eukprot:CFRG6363T1
MRCHYEVLNVSRTADDNEIKKVYRQLARKNHPDKHPEDPELYTKIFREIQGAYDTLSDKHERKWYDDHRDVILSGGTGTDKTGGHGLDLYTYFSSSCFSGFDDDSKGFYCVYRTVFETIEIEDREANRDSNIEYPTFGTRGSDYLSTVKSFYSFWEYYSSCKRFGYADEYNPLDAPNRMVRRMVEKENKKLREAEKKQYNERVRELVKFVLKRDKRVQEYKLMEEVVRLRKEKENRELATEHAKFLKLKRQQEMEETLKTYKEQDWNRTATNVPVMSEFLTASDSEEKSEIEAADVESDCDTVGFSDEEFELACVACVKIFDSKKALNHHNTTKKHKRKVDTLRREMEADDDMLQDDEDNMGVSVEGSDFSSCDSTLAPLSEYIVQPSSDATLKATHVAPMQDDMSFDDTKSYGENKKKQAKVDRHGVEVLDQEVLKSMLGVLALSDSDMEIKSNNQRKKKNRRAFKAKTLISGVVGPSENQTSTDLPAGEPTRTKPTPHKCDICTEKFETRNGLFAHLEYQHEMRKGRKQGRKKR